MLDETGDEEGVRSTAGAAYAGATSTVLSLCRISISEANRSAGYDTVSEPNFPPNFFD